MVVFKIKLIKGHFPYLILISLFDIIVIKKEMRQNLVSFAVSNRKG